jgi:hypothetical protein
LCLGLSHCWFHGKLRDSTLCAHFDSHHRHLPPYHLQSKDRAKTLARLTIDSTMAPYNSTTVHLSIITHPQPGLHWAMPLRHVVVDAIDEKPLHLLLPTSNTCFQETQHGYRYRKSHRHSI